MKKWLVITYGLLLGLTFSCKKAAERSCFKSAGEPTERIVQLDSTPRFRLFKHIKYHFYQDTLNQVIIKGGKNLVNLITVESDSGLTTIENHNKCHFLRKYNQEVEVEIHTPVYYDVYMEPSDSVIFHGNFKGPYLSIEIRDGGGVVVLDSDIEHLNVTVSFGVGSFILTGQSNFADLRVQNQSFGDALGFKSKHYRLYQNSSNDLKVNVDSAIVDILIKGNGDILYQGIPDSVHYENVVGDGEFIPY